MPLDKHKFKFQSHYIGWWTLPDIPDNKISGTLFIEEHRMWIELYFKPITEDFPETIESLIGCTSGMDADGKEYSANMLVEGLEYVRWCHLENGLWHYKYDVSRIFIYDGNLERDNVSSICIRADILDCWCSNYLEASYHEVPYNRLPYGHHIIHHILPHTKTLYKNDKICVSLFFPCSYSIGGINQGVTQKAFLKIAFFKNCSFQDSMYYVNQILYLFYILTNRIFPIDYLYSESGCNVSFYRVNDFSLYRFIEKRSNLTPHVTLNDFSNLDINLIFQKWVDLYSEHSDALNSYFENHTNIYTSPSSKIKNFISTIDTLSKDLPGSKGDFDLSTKKAKYLLKIIEKYNIAKNDANELKSRFLQSSGVELKVRFSNLLKAVEKYLSEHIESDFIIKAVNTRHNIIHPKANMQPCFTPNEYNTVASKLNQIILTYILVLLETPDSVIDKILKSSGYASTLS